MARSLNKVMLIGSVGDEPSCRTFDNGGRVANFSIATNEARPNDAGGFTEFTEWHRINAWGRTAEIVESYVHKGSRIFVEGKLRTRHYNGKDNQKRYITEIYAENVILLDRRDHSNNNNIDQGYGQGHYGADQNPYSAPQNAPYATNPWGGQEATSSAFEGYGAAPSAPNTMAQDNQGVVAQGAFSNRSYSSPYNNQAMGNAPSPYDNSMGQAQAPTQVAPSEPTYQSFQNFGANQNSQTPATAQASAHATAPNQPAAPQGGYTNGPDDDVPF